MKVIREKNYGQYTFINKACDEVEKIVQPYSKIRLRTGKIYTDIHLSIKQGINMYNTKIHIIDNETNFVNATGHIQNNDSVFFVDRRGNNIEFLN